MDDDYVALAIQQYWGHRCKEYHPECHCCLAWKQYDDLKARAAIDAMQAPSQPPETPE